MILQSREQRERADVSASLSGMELALREKEMESMALDRSERRKLQKMQITMDKDRFNIEKDKAFREKLTKIQQNEINNLHVGAATLFDTMFSQLFRNNTAGGANLKEGNYNSLVNDLTGKHYKFGGKDAKRIANAIMSYGSGKDKPNPYAMASLARFMKERATDKNFINSLTRGGMIADPRENPESFKGWITNLEGLTRTEANTVSLQKEWHDFTDADEKNDYTMRPLEGAYDFAKSRGQGGGTGGGGTGSDAISKQLYELEAYAKDVEDYKKKRDMITGDSTLTKKEQKEAISKLKYVAYDSNKEQTPSIYQTVMQDYDAKPGYMAGGSEDSDLQGKNIYMNQDTYALKDPKDAVDSIADFRDSLLKEKKDATKSVKGFQKTLDLAKNLDYEGLGTENKAKIQEAKIGLFRESERLSTINDAIDKFYIQADIETEKYIGETDWWTGDPTGAKRFREGAEPKESGTDAFPFRLLTKSEMEDNIQKETINRGFQKLRSSSGRLY